MAGRKWVGLAFVSVTGAIVGFSGCTGEDPFIAVDGGAAEAGDATGKKDIAASCANADECGSGFCVDGFCCDAACNGVCESCSLPESRGKCSPIPDGQDPEKECKVLDALDGGSVDDDGGSDGGGIPLPEAGVSKEPGACAPKCNGQRACGYPGAKQRCGTAYCNGELESVFLSCDGRGNCEGLTQETCGAYKCEPTGGACRTNCAALSDCGEGTYCSISSKCEPKKAVGVACTLPTDCVSGFCEGDQTGKVCCETECSGDGRSCVKAGNFGKCQCGDCAGGGACKLYYEDKDGDGYGNRDATFANGKAKYDCATATPAGYSDNNLDCWDENDAKGKLVNPAQTEHQKDGYGPGALYFDYNCDGKQLKYYNESPGASCTYCAGNIIDCNPKSPNTCSSTSTVPGHSCGLVSVGIYKGCGSIRATSFRANVDCGKTATLYTCNACSAVGNGPGTTSTAPGTYQKCL